MNTIKAIKEVSSSKLNLNKNIREGWAYMFKTFGKSDHKVAKELADFKYIDTDEVKEWVW